MTAILYKTLVLSITVVLGSAMPPAALAQNQAPEQKQPEIQEQKQEQNLPVKPLDRGRAAFAAGDMQGALAAFEPFAVEQPENLAVHYWLGCTYYELGQIQRAHAEYAQAMRLASTIKYDGPHLRLNMGNLLAQYGGVEDASFDYERAIELDPSVKESFLGAAKCQVKAGNFDRASRALEIYKKLGGKDPSIYLVDGLIKVGQGRYDQAKVALETFVSGPPEQAQTDTTSGDRFVRDNPNGTLNNIPQARNERALALARDILTRIDKITR